jgi:4,4'-diaponeurosporenoate glycosyltransferase
VGWVLFAAGWSVGWLLLWSNRRFPPPRTERPAMAVVVPARDEAGALPLLLTPLLAQLRPGDGLVVVDDHSSDGTAAVASSQGATVVVAPDLPPGWVGKPHACWVGAQATTQPILVFLDADVRPGAGVLDRLAAAIAEDAAAVVSVQPWHDAVLPDERITALASVVTLMGSGGFTIAGSLRPRVAFGPVLAMTRAVYDRAGGHAHQRVRASLTEDIALAHLVGRSRVFSDRRDASFRMSFSGWSRTMAAGISATRWWLGLAVVAWVWSLAGGLFVGWLAYPLSAVQVWVLGRRAGRCGPVLAACYPLLVVALVAIVGRAAWHRVRGVTSWKGRTVSAA